MSDTRVPDEVVTDLAVARGALQQAWRAVEDLRGYARGAERALQDAELETGRAFITTDGVLGAGYLRSAGAQVDVLRQRCALSSELASEIEERLDTAKRHIDAARGRLDVQGQAGGFSPEVAADVASLRAKVDELAGIVALASPLAQAARTYMQQAAGAAADLTTPGLAQGGRDSVVRIDRGVQSAGRAVARADEATLHLDRTVEYATAGATRSLGHADMLAAAGQRLPTAHQHPPGTSTSPPPPGPSR